MTPSTSSSRTSPPPRYRTPRNPALGTDAGATRLVARAFGRSLIPWQELLADLAGEQDPAHRGRYAHPVIVCEVPRQTGKTTTVFDIALGRCLSRPGFRAAYTAQTGLAAAERFRERVDALGRTDLAPLARSRMSRGSERLTFRNGSELKLFPPLPDALRGDHLDMVIVDEAQEHDEARGRELDQAIIPTFTTRPWRQLLVIGTAGTDASAYFRRYVDLGRAGGSSVGYLEFSADPDADVTDPAVWAAHHPGLGFTTDEAALAAALEAMGPTSFAREFLNIWPRLDATVIPAERWSACLADGVDHRPAVTIPDGAAITVGFDVNYGRTAGSVAVAARVGERIAVEVVDAGLAVADLPDRLAVLAARYRATVVGAPAQRGIVDDLKGRGVGARVTSGQEYQAACQLFYDAVVAGRLAHRGQPDLDGAVAAAGRSRSGDAWAWSHRSSAAPIDPLVAATVALAAVGQAKPEADWAFT